MLRVCLIGAGDVQYHYQDLLKIPEPKFNKHLTKIAKVLAKNSEILLLPDRGVSFEIAKLYKENSGSRVIATYPASDSTFGTKHLEPFLNAELNGKKIFDETINTDNWYKQDLTHCLFGDVILLLGNTLGALGELAYGYYLYKLIAGHKPELKMQIKNIHPEARAGINTNFSLIVYKPFVKGKLSWEIEQSRRWVVRFTMLRMLKSWKVL